MNERTETLRLKAGPLEVLIAPELGFSLMSFTRDGRELLDPGAEGAFMKTRKGLGPLILPHFNQDGPRPRAAVEGFPHVAELARLGVDHPFQHGVGRYAPWRAEASRDSVTGRLDGGMRWKGILLSDLAGMDFSAAVTFRLRDEGLGISFDLRGDGPVAAGIHFYYRLEGRSGARVRLPRCLREAPEELDLSQPVNRVFVVEAAGKERAVCRLESGNGVLDTIFPVGGDPQESFGSLVIFSPAGADFACVEPVSYPVGEGNTKKTFRGDILLVPR